MMSVPLTHGFVALIDDDDAPTVLRHTWWADINGDAVYARAWIDGSYVRMHRLITGAPSGVCVDHIDRNGLNNCRANLRTASKRSNGLNRGSQRNSRSGFKGVYWCSGAKSYRAQIKYADHHRSLGYFTDAIEAAKAYDAAARQLHGEFACLNFPDEKWTCS